MKEPQYILHIIITNISYIYTISFLVLGRTCITQTLYFPHEFDQNLHRSLITAGLPKNEGKRTLRSEL